MTNERLRAVADAERGISGQVGVLLREERLGRSESRLAPERRYVGPAGGAEK